MKTVRIGFMTLLLMGTVFGENVWARFPQPRNILRTQSLANEIAFDFVKGKWVIRFHDSITPVPRNRGRAGRDLPGGAVPALGVNDNGWGVSDSIVDPKYIFNEAPGGWNELPLFIKENGIKKSIVPMELQGGEEVFRFTALRLDENGRVFPRVLDRDGRVVSTGGFALTEEVDDSRVGFGFAKHRNPDNTTAWKFSGELNSMKLATMMLFEDEFNGVETSSEIIGPTRVVIYRAKDEVFVHRSIMRGLTDILTQAALRDREEAFPLCAASVSNDWAKNAAKPCLDTRWILQPDPLREGWFKFPVTEIGCDVNVKPLPKRRFNAVRVGQFGLAVDADDDGEEDWTETRLDQDQIGAGIAILINPPSPGVPQGTTSFIIDELSCTP